MVDRSGKVKADNRPTSSILIRTSPESDGLTWTDIHRSPERYQVDANGVCDLNDSAYVR
ncbi:MAG: hypothetical protein N0E48_01645 [Candidatus Thiodiazotropha endolucinida]|nr:hypothetical protein [Candidatus Thiodiazotropha taylori]MCW4342064.1 hypothetical protein [Candidatus Thiodiazotropha endolucinida]